MNNEKVNMNNPSAYFSPMAPTMPSEMYNQPSQYFPQQPQQVFVQQSPILGPDPVTISCPNCRARVVTEVTDFATMRTHSMALLIAMIGCALGCCLIPYCTKSFQSQKHTCPMCRSVIGIYKN